MAAYPDKGLALSTVKICQRVDRTGSATERKAGCGRPKLVGGHVKKSITSSFFNRITFHLAVRCRAFQKINLQNFKFKLQTVAEKTAQKL